MLARPSGVAYDAAGDLFLADADNHVIREVSAAGVVTTVAGSGVAGFGGDGGTATSAYLDTPTGVAVDAQGTLYIADSHNHRVRKVSNGTITTVAGNGTAGFAGDSGPATSAQLALPSAVAVDASGDLYVADTNNHRIRRLSGGVLTTFAGNGEELFAGDGGPASSASLDQPTGVAVDAAGNVFIADRNNHRIRVVNSTGIISTAAGNGSGPFSGAFGGDGSLATLASLAKPTGVAVDTAGNLLIVDSNNQRLRQVSSGGTITSVAGTGEQGFAGDSGPATLAVLNAPRAAAVDGSGNFVLADTGNQRIRASTLPQINFGTQAVGSTSAPQAITLSNTGSGPLIVASVKFSGPFLAAAGGSCPVPPISLSPGMSCVQDLSFQPVADGPVSGSVSLGGQGLASQVVLLTGTASSTSTSLLLAADKPSVLSGESVALSATLTSPGGSVQGAAGSVAFYAGGQLLGTSPISSGIALFTTSSLPAGTQSITAAYAGSKGFGGSSSATLVENVADIHLSLGAVQGVTIVPGQSTAVPLSLAAIDAVGLSGTVTLATASLPNGLTVTFSPAASALQNGQLPFTMNVAAAGTSASATPGFRTGAGAAIGLGLFLLPFSRLRRSALRTKWLNAPFTLLAILALSAGTASLTGCGASSGFLAQKQQTYNVTITATATDTTGGSLSRSTVVAITVQ